MIPYADSNIKILLTNYKHCSPLLGSFSFLDREKTMFPRPEFWPMHSEDGWQLSPPSGGWEKLLHKLLWVWVCDLGWHVTGVRNRPLVCSAKITGEGERQCANIPLFQWSSPASFPLDTQQKNRVLLCGQRTSLYKTKCYMSAGINSFFSSKGNWLQFQPPFQQH